MDRIIHFFSNSGNIVQIIVASLILFVLRYYLIRHFIPWLVKRSPTALNRRILSYYINSILIMIIILVVIGKSDLDVAFFTSFNHQAIHFSNILLAFVAIQAAFLIYYLVNQLFLKTADTEGDSDRPLTERDFSGSDSFKYVLGVVAIKFLVNVFGLNYTLYQTDDITIDINDVLKILLIVLLANFISYLFIRVFLKRYYRRKNFNSGAQYSINQLVKYIIYVILFLIGLESIGIGLKVVWGGLAALMVGIGFGLQRTFADLMAGIILLFERSVEIGNTIEIEGERGIVKKIGLRTTIVKKRDERLMVVPNSKIIDNTFVNWDLEHPSNRFSIEVGVAYGTDTEKVKEILLNVARVNTYIETRPEPMVRLIDFGDNAIQFELFFWSRVLLTIEDVKSDLRFAIAHDFQKEGVTIPFPQRDVWMRSVPNSESNHDEPSKA